MLYKKNGNKVLSDELFKSPTSEYRGAPFWSWNTKIEKELIEEQILHMKEMGFGGFHIHSRTGLDTPYLGDEFMDMVKHANEFGKDNDMLTWLYDEDRWSSGAAGGMVTVKPVFRRKRLALYPNAEFENIPKEVALCEGKPYLLACYDLELDCDGYIKCYKRIGFNDNSVSGTKWYAYVENEKNSTWFNGYTYPDTGNDEAIDKFIEITHERYKEILGSEFDKTIPAIFTDEPNINHEKSITIPSPEFKNRILHSWSLNFDSEYKKDYGQDLLDVLPELIWNKKDRSDSIVKYRFFDLKAKLFAENFSKRIGEWCNKNGIALTGHLLREPDLWSQAITCGETMRSYEYFEIPGVDILCDLREFTTVKQAQSVVHQLGKKALMSELYGVTGWDYDFRGHKSQGDWQAALGVSVRVPHLNWMSMAGEAKRDYPAAIGYQSPWYSKYSYVEDHFARVNTAMTRGTACVKIGVIHPVESYWINAGPNTQCACTVNSLEENFDNITKWLLESHLDFDYICESTIPKFENGIAIGQMEYDAIVIPSCITLRKTTLDFIKKCKNAGKKVIFAGGYPTYIDGVKYNDCNELFSDFEIVNFDKASIVQCLEQVRNVEIVKASGDVASELIYSYRNDTDCDWLFIAHSVNDSGLDKKYGAFQCDVTVPMQAKIKIKGEFIPIEYDTLSGDIKPVKCVYSNGFTVIDRQIHTYDSILLKLVAGKQKSDNVEEHKLSKVKNLEVESVVDYNLSEPNVLLLDCAEYSVDDSEYFPKDELLRADNHVREILGFPKRIGHLAQPYTMEKQKEQHTLSLKFEFYSNIEYDGAFLAMEDVEKNTLIFNGLPIDNTPVGYFTDKSIKKIRLPLIKKGKNIIQASLPFGPRTNVEWCYILGDFGVELYGKTAVIDLKPQKLGFSDIVSQKHPFYSANITYSFNVTMDEDGYLDINTSYYRGSLVSVCVDGKEIGNIAYSPYSLMTDKLTKGNHRIELTLYGNRFNSFGPLHAVNLKQKYLSPDAWRTVGDDWMYEYHLKPFGILKSPVITFCK